jgi:Transposase IS116/IS110/IS902 family
MAKRFGPPGNAWARQIRLSRSRSFELGTRYAHRARKDRLEKERHYNAASHACVRLCDACLSTDLSSWAGISPGNEQSAGKRLRNRTTRKNRWLRRALTEAAWALGRTKSSYLGAQYRRLAPRRGKKRALVAVGHSLLVIFYHMLKHEGLEYKDLGVDYFDRLEPERLRSYLVKRLQRLGYRVTLTPEGEADAA